MVWISRVIKQDVNIFDGPTLLATSQRDLFAQGLLPERTPDTVYRAIVLQRLPTFVGEDQIGPLQYQLAATPIRVGTRDAILTVPMTLRQREIEREIAELDRSVNLGVVVFILLGAALGYSISGRIGDPVQRLTRASRRIAAGDLDQHVVARTADELQGLVEAFNSMAAELSRQREQLQRTQSPRGVGRDGAAGRARHQESADADSAVGRAPPARPSGSRHAALAGARAVRRHHPAAGAHAAADLLRVRELCVLADGTPGADAAARPRRGGAGRLPHRPAVQRARRGVGARRPARRAASIARCSAAR